MKEIDNIITFIARTFQNRSFLNNYATLQTFCLWKVENVFGQTKATGTDTVPEFGEIHIASI